MEGYRAHFFDFAGNSATSIAFRDYTGHSIVIGSAGPRFELVGQEVNDASENLGPLFVGQTPSLSIVDGSWEDVGMVQGNLMTRSHYGDLQFLHGMAVADGLPAEVTRTEVLQWLQFAWSVATGGIKADTPLRNLDIPLIKDRFGCTGWTVTDLYLLGRVDKMLRNLDDVAFGSVLHTVQDSFAAGHVERESPVGKDQCGADVPFPRPGSIIEFHSYALQDGSSHDKEDYRDSMIRQVNSPWPEAVEASRNLVSLYRQRKNWSEVEPYLQCLFTLSALSRPSSPGENFRRSPIS